MGEQFKLDINIPQKKIEEMAKQVIREIVQEKIEKVMDELNINKIVKDKINNSVDIKLKKVINDSIKKEINDMRWKIECQSKQIVRDIVLEEIQKKPLSGNVYLKINSNNVETDYDY